MEQTIRVRTSNGPVEVRESRRLTWYAAVFDSPAKVFDFYPGNTRERVQYEEVILAGAFADSLRSGTDIRATVNHDEARTIARRSDGLLLQEDRRGLFASAWVPDTELGDSLISDVKAGKITGGSFVATNCVERVRADGVVEVVKAPIYDVCVTGKPAYKATDVTIRTDNRETDLFRRLRLAKIRLSLLDIGVIGNH